MAYTLSLVAKLGATVIFNRISRVDVNISLEELFRSNIEDRGNDVKLVKVKVGEERGGPWSDIDGSETVQSCKDMQLRCISCVSWTWRRRRWSWRYRRCVGWNKSHNVCCIQNLTRCFILFYFDTIHMTDNKYCCKCVFTLVLWSEFTSEVIKKKKSDQPTLLFVRGCGQTNIFFFGLTSKLSIFLTNESYFIIKDEDLQ